MKNNDKKILIAVLATLSFAIYGAMVVSKMVPVIKNADQLNLVGLTKKVNGMDNAARNNKLRPDDTAGGTFTMTNVGSFGSIMGTPIINQPQVAILAVGAIKKKPVVIEAIEFTRNNFQEIRDFTDYKADTLTIERRIDGIATCIIPTLEGQHIATEGDYIIKGVEGEFYPCKPDIFEKTYEKVGSPE